MMALSLRQPWAWLVTNGIRSVVYRTTATSHRGELLIHAGQDTDPQGWAWCRTAAPATARRMPAPEVLTRGGIVGRARLVACIRASEDWWRWMLVDAETLPFHRCRGLPDLFRVDLETSP